MTRTARLSLLLALLFGPLRAATFDAAPIETAPKPGASAAAAAPSAVSVPALSLAAPLSAPSAAAPLAAPAPLAALPAAPAALAPALAPAAPVPAASPVRASSVRAAAADGPRGPPAAASAASAAEAPDAGRALFDQAAEDKRPLSEIVRENSGRSLRNGVFIQQEHEGSLLAPDRRDSSGDVFRYYKPVEFRPDLTAQVDSGLTGFSGFIYKVRRALQLSGRNAPDAAWRAWPLSARLEYLDRLEKAVVSERGPQAAWDGKVSLILERSDGAPDFVTKNPHMEAPPDARKGDVGAKFYQPEIVSDKAHPAASVSQALGRAKMIIGDTAHAGVQFHVFVKAEPKALLAQIDALDGALQLVNDVLFAQAAAGSDLNITHASLMPWHRGRSERVRALLLKAGKDPHVPAADDFDSEKHASLGFRYWGMEDGKAVVSLELRGTSLPWKRASNAMRMEDGKAPERDYESARAYLTFLSLYAEALAAGRAPKVPVESAVIDEAAAEASLQARAKEMGMPPSAYDGLGALARRLTGAKKTPLGYLYPFAASKPGSPELRALEGEILIAAARLKSLEEAGLLDDQRPHYRYLFWTAYKEWADSFGARRSAQLATLVRAVSR